MAHQTVNPWSESNRFKRKIERYMNDRWADMEWEGDRESSKTSFFQYRFMAKHGLKVVIFGPNEDQAILSFEHMWIDCTRDQLYSTSLELNEDYSLGWDYLESQIDHGMGKSMQQLEVFVGDMMDSLQIYYDQQK